MRLTGIELPCLYEDTEEYLIFEEEDELRLGTELAALTFCEQTLRASCRALTSERRFLLIVEFRGEEGKRGEEFSSALLQWLRGELGYRIGEEDELLIAYRENKDAEGLCRSRN
ncbi:MAG: hypothetical protein Q4A78_11740 [Peptostreptococcaceae bacterium]|nr:hypothetical protein [Peptostreptococcaceae bacterium]